MAKRKYLELNRKIPWDKIDKGLREVIYLLNKKGYKTILCCEGHWSETRNGYTDTDIFFCPENLPRRPRVEGIVQPAMAAEKAVDNPIITYNGYQYDIVPDHGWGTIRFVYQNEGLTREEKDAVHQRVLDKLLEWAENLEEKDTNECLRRENILKRLMTFVNYKEQPEWNEFYEMIDDPEIDIEKEWQNVWKNKLDHKFNNYYHDLAKGILGEGYCIYYEVYDEQEMVRRHYFYDPEEVFEFAHNDVLGENETTVVYLTYNGYTVDTDAGYYYGGDSENKNSLMSHTGIYRYLTEANLFLPQLYLQNIIINFEVKTGDNIIKSQNYLWNVFMDCCVYRYDESRDDWNYWDRFTLEQIVDEINEFLDTVEVSKESVVTCYLCPSELNESEDPDINRVIELSSGGTRHIGYYDLKRIYLSAVELLAKEWDEFLKW